MISAELDRRGFLQAAGGLLVAFAMPDISRADTSSAEATLNAYVHIAPDETVTLFISKAEMGQGTVTSLSMLIAEELECDWKTIRTEFPGVDPKSYGPMQGVFGSASIRTQYHLLRQAGANARQMLIEAAAQKWGVVPSQCRAENGFIVSGSNRASFGSLADAAGRLRVPSDVALKDPKDFRLIGTTPHRLDTLAKITGKTEFGIDCRLPGLLYAVLARCPVFGGRVASFDATKTKSVPGVKNVIEISNGVAIVADNTWSAIEGRKALKVLWDEGPMANASNQTIRKMFADLAKNPGAIAKTQGDAEAALSNAPRKIEAVYEAPYLAHAPMEPLNCTAHVRADGCEVWAATQIQTAAMATAQKVTGLPFEKVKIHTLWLGGGFGRRGGADYIREAVEIAKQIGVPVKLTWTREDDIQHDMYRPGSYTKFAASLGADGWPEALHARIACPSFAGLRNGVDFAAVEGIADMAYEIPNFLVDYHPAEAGIPTTFWRSVGYSQNTFFAESFIDELAAASKKDPLEFRRRMLKNQSRLLAALDLAADKAGWGKPLPAGHGLGIGVVNNIGSFNAQIAEVSVEKNKVRVHRVVCAVDCGQTVHPAIIDQQIQSGIVFGLTAALKGTITIERGRVVEQNFNHYDVLRIDEMPVIEVHVMKSQAAPGGIGEASTPTIAPAVANAVFATTGKRIRRLPIRIEELA